MVVLLCTLLYSTVQSTVVQYLCFKPRISRSKRKSSGDVAGTDYSWYFKKRQVIMMETKVEEEEVTEEPKGFTTQEMAGDFLYLRRRC